MTSQVLKDLQHLHFKSQFLRLEDVSHLKAGPVAGQSESDKTPASPSRYHLQCPDQKQPVTPVKDKAKIPLNQSYFYRSPCPEKHLSRAAPEAKDVAVPAQGLTEKAAQFCKENKIDGFSCKIFVGNISYKVKDSQLREFFDLFGKVIRANVCKDKKTKRSRGFGFVIFSNREEAERALNAEDYQLTLNGRLMTVSWAERRRGRYMESSSTPESQCIQDLALSLLETEKNNRLLHDQGNTSPEEAPINKLNDDILLEIFKNLSIKERIQVERVCKRWLNIARTSLKSLVSLDFKRMFKAFEGTGGLTDRIFSSILKKGCENLHSLDLSASPYLLTSHGLFALSSICTELRYLNLSGVAVTNNNLKDIGQKCQKLETLVLGRCRDFGEKGLWWFLKQAKMLQRLEVTDNVRINGKCFWMLHKSCKELILRDCVKVSDNGLENISGRAPYLQVLDITNCLLVTDVGLSKIFTSCPNLRILKVAATGPGVTSHGLKAIAASANLEFLDISQNKAVIDDVIHAISNSCRNLQYLNIEACHSDITDEAIKSISNLQQLKELNISYLTEITDRSIEYLSVNCSLRSIRCRVCSKLTNHALACLLLSCGDSFCEIDLSGCFSIDDQFLESAPITKRDSTLPVLKINLGETSIAADKITELQNAIGNCFISLDKTYNNRLRTDFDPTSYSSLMSSDDEDECSEDVNRPFHPFSAKGYTVRSDDLHCPTSSNFVLDDGQMEDFLENDDPAFLNELEEEFMLH